MNKQTTQSALAESVSKNNDQKQGDTDPLQFGFEYPFVSLARSRTGAGTVALGRPWFWLTRLISLSLADVFRPPMVSVKLPKSVLVVFHLWRATKLPNFFQVKSRAGCSL